MSAAQSDRRLEVSEAAWRVIVREGLDRTSMRAVAQEMNCTTGVVTHYFRNKQELILFALHQVTERLQGLMEQAVANLAGCDRLVAMLSSFLPIDREHQDILRVWVAFLGYAVGREDLMADHQQSAGELRQVIIQELVSLQGQTIIRPDINPEIEANVLLALVNGLSLDTLIQLKHLSSEQQKIALQSYVNRLLYKEAV
ncbi:MAG: TetR/AcrR family transcriptional regulator [Cyanobacteria bacterium P01_C01_bin.70]